MGGALLKKGPRPPWQIPGAANEALSNARQMASSTRPGDQQQIDLINRNAGSTINVLRRSVNSGSQLLAGASQVNANTNQALAQNSAANDQYRFNAKMNLQSELGRFAAFQREKFVKDVFEPYEQRAQTKSMLLGAGMQNMFGGLDSAANFGMQQKYLNSYGSQPQDGTDLSSLPFPGRKTMMPSLSGFAPFRRY